MTSAAHERPGRGADMTRPKIGPQLSSKYNAFLRFSLWEENNGMPLSILSALAKLDVDPWQEAEALSQLPQDSAFQRLALLLQRLPGKAPLQPELETICQRSTGLLPRLNPEPTSRSGIAATPQARFWSLATSSFFFGVVYLVTFSLMQAHQPSDKVRSVAVSAPMREQTIGHVLGPAH